MFRKQSGRLMFQVARRHGYNVEGNFHEFNIDKEAWHAEAWKVKFNHNSGYWEVWTRQDNGEDGPANPEWSRAKYSLRDIDDVFDFLQIVKLSERIRAKSHNRKLKAMKAA